MIVSANRCRFMQNIVFNMRFSSIYMLGIAAGLVLAAIGCTGNGSTEQETTAADSAKQAYTELYAMVDSLAKKIPAKLGVAMLNIETGDTFSYNGYEHMPMQSTYKFPLALMVMDEIDKGRLDLQGETLISKSMMDEETHSPLRDKYGMKDVHISLHEIVYYTVAQSDNIGCDVLFRLVGGPARVDSFMHAKGFKGIQIVSTEAELHEDVNRQYDNWTEPVEMVNILSAFYQQKLISKTATDTLRNIMERTTGGAGRIKGLLPAGTVVAHKTGTCAPDDGVNTINDTGVITMPDGKHLAIAIYVADAKADIYPLAKK